MKLALAALAFALAIASAPQFALTLAAEEKAAAGQPATVTRDAPANATAHVAQAADRKSESFLRELDRALQEWCEAETQVPGHVLDLRTGRCEFIFKGAASPL